MESPKEKHPSEWDELVRLRAFLDSDDAILFPQGIKPGELPQQFIKLFFDSAYDDPNGTDSAISELAEKLGIPAAERPPEWRIEIWKRLVGKRLFQAISPFSEKKETASEQGFCHGVRLQVNRFCDRMYGISPFASPVAKLSSILPEYISPEDIFYGLLNQSPKNVVEYIDGLKMGITTQMTENGEIVNENSLQEAYLLLVDNTEVVEDLKTQEEVFRFLKNKMGRKLTNEFENFRRNFTRIGLKSKKRHKFEPTGQPPSPLLSRDSEPLPA